MADDKHQSRTVAKEELDGVNGVYVVDQKLAVKNAEDGRSSDELAPGLKTAADGTIVLIPQPTDDPADPLNCKMTCAPFHIDNTHKCCIGSWLKKHAVFLSLLPGCFLTDWVITWGTTLFVAQVPTFKYPPPHIAQSLSPAIFLQGPGGLLAVPLCQRFGR